MQALVPHPVVIPFADTVLEKSGHRHTIVVIPCRHTCHHTLPFTPRVCMSTLARHMDSMNAQHKTADGLYSYVYNVIYIYIYILYIYTYNVCVPGLGELGHQLRPNFKGPGLGPSEG